MNPISRLMLSMRLNSTIIALCLGSMLYGNVYALGQSVKATAQYLSTIHQHDSERAGQVKSITDRNGQQDTDFTYDVRGNILTKTVDGKKTTYTYNTLNQLITIQKPDGSSIDLSKDYDALGNMKQDPNHNAYGYNILGQLITFDNQQTGVKASYHYYANGLRAEKAIASNPAVAPIYYYYDNAQYANIVNEKQGPFSASYLLPSSHMVRYVNDGKGNVAKQVAIHGSKDVEAILDQNGKIQKTYHYSPNGIVKPIHPADQIAQLTQPKAIDFSIVQNPFQYSGQYRDSESGLDYLRARYYNPQIQRFIQRDSYQLLNRYNYVNGNPIMNVDTSGHHMHKLGKWLIGIAAVLFTATIIAFAIKKSITSKLTDTEFQATEKLIQKKGVTSLCMQKVGPQEFHLAIRDNEAYVKNGKYIGKDAAEKKLLNIAEENMKKATSQGAKFDNDQVAFFKQSAACMTEGLNQSMPDYLQKRKEFLKSIGLDEKEAITIDGKYTRRIYNALKKGEKALEHPPHSTPQVTLNNQTSSNAIDL